MIYLIGGVPRAGKSAIAKALLTIGAIPYLGVDYIKMAFAKSMPDLGVNPVGDDARTARQLWPFVEAMIITMIENSQDYTLEAVYILPEYAQALVRTHPDSIRTCFVGFELVETNHKVRELKEHRGEGDDWLRNADGDELIRFVNRAKKQSGSLRLQCEALGLRYFDNSSNFQQTVDDVATYLLSRYSDDP